MVQNTYILTLWIYMVFLTVTVQLLESDAGTPLNASSGHPVQMRCVMYCTLIEAFNTLFKYLELYLCLYGVEADGGSIRSQQYVTFR
jgi:hypothetical protein